MRGEKGKRRCEGGETSATWTMPAPATGLPIGANTLQHICKTTEEWTFPERPGRWDLSAPQLSPCCREAFGLMTEVHQGILISGPEISDLTRER